MKKLTFLFILTLVLPSLSSAQDSDICAQVMTTAVSPGGQCQTFSTPCEVPADWKSVPSCDIVGDDSADQPSLEQKQHDRLAKMREYWQAKKQARDNKSTGERDNQTFNRLGSGSLTRSDRLRRLPTSQESNTTGVRRTFTDKNYHSDVAERYSLRGGYQRAGDTTSAERQERRQSRPSYMSRSDADRSGNLKNTVRWNVLSDQFTTKKSYGANPYRIRSQYIAEQKAKRDASNQEVDVQERKMSRSRVYRGERLDGDLSGDALLDN